MSDLDTLAEQAARRAMMAPKGKRNLWSRIAQTIRLAALASDPTTQRAILQARLICLAALTNNPAQRRAILELLEA